MSDRRGFCERHFGAYLVADGCPYCEPGEAVTVKTGWHDFKPAHPPGKLLTTAQKGLTLTPHARMEFVNAMLDHRDEDGNPAPMISREDAVKMLGGLTPAQETDLERAADKACAYNSRQAIAEMAHVPEPEAWCPTCGGVMDAHEGGGMWKCPVMTADHPPQIWLGPHEVWRRWKDTDKAEGFYWSYDTAVGASPTVRVSHFIDTGLKTPFEAVLVLGPIPQPKAPR